ncbi:unnamed protein product [Effrenium voratum]|nr:unnamed protein product [Effrenium voratum]
MPPTDFFESSWWEKTQKARRTIEEVADLKSTWTAVESYQKPRLLSGGEVESWRIVVSLAWSFTWHGIPEIWYGAEFGFTGLCYRNQEEREELLQRMLSSGISSGVAQDLLNGCDYSAKGPFSVNQGFWRQETCSPGGPWSSASRKSIRTRRM